jgi:hypothetical protein
MYHILLLQKFIERISGTILGKIISSFKILTKIRQLKKLVSEIILMALIFIYLERSFY